MTKKSLTNLDKLLEKLNFGNDSKIIIEEGIEKGLKRKPKMDPFNFDLQNMILIPLEKEMIFTFNKMRKTIEADIKDNFSNKNYKPIFVSELGFFERPTCKALFSKLIYMIQHKEI